ncbi:hypothetical protein AB0B66_37205 [Catellatospora sp. NPDC049111]|uniref:hypothetical protein n=1 Tax=Catellatospora sp. NPDC049111 TaxID=3155271 RepID=UPI0033E0D061
MEQDEQRPDTTAAAVGPWPWAGSPADEPPNTSGPVSATPPGPDLYQAPWYAVQPSPDPSAPISFPGGPPPGPDLGAGGFVRERSTGPLTPDTPGVFERLLRRLRSGA